MEKIIQYLTDEITMLTEKADIVEGEIKSKKIILSEIKKAVEKLSSSDDAFHVFSANDNNSTFNNREIEHLKKQEKGINENILLLKNNREEINRKILYLKELLTNANKINDNFVTVHRNISDENKPDVLLKAEDPDTQIMNVSEPISIEKIVDDLKTISTRIELAAKLIKTDSERCKMELGLARMKLLFCIDEMINS